MNIVGHNYAKNIFINQMVEDKNAPLNHHAFLFHGVRGIGKSHFAWEISAYLLETNIPSLKQGMHPDFYYLTAPEEGKRIAIATVRDAIYALSLTATQNKRVLLIDLADDLGGEAANALLKLIEEPPKGSYLFLVSESPSKLLSTIRSRVLPIALSPLSEIETFDVLRQKGVDIKSLSQNPIFIGLFVGRPGLILQFYAHDCHLFLENLHEIISQFPQQNWEQFQKFTSDLTAIEFYCFCQYISQLFVTLAMKNGFYLGLKHVPMKNILKTWEKVHHYLYAASLPKGMGVSNSHAVYFILHSLLFLSKKYS